MALTGQPVEVPAAGLKWIVDLSGFNVHACHFVGQRRLARTTTEAASVLSGSQVQFAARYVSEKVIETKEGVTFNDVFENKCSVRQEWHLEKDPGN